MRAAWVCCVVGLLFVGCGGASGERPSGSPPPNGGHNILLIVVDTLRADHVGAHGEVRVATPHLDRLAAEGVRFDRAYAVSPWTKPSVATLFTGLMPSSHGLRRLGQGLADERETLAELLGEQGFATAGVVSHRLLGAKWGFDQGYEVFDESPIGDHRAITSKAVTDRAIELLDRIAGERFHLFVHYFDPHYAYMHHPDFDITSSYGGELAPGIDIRVLRAERDEFSRRDVDYLKGLYAEEVANTDRSIGRLLDHLERLDLTHDTWVVVTADHGEEFMERGWIGHTRSLHEELIRVPLIFSLPGECEPATITDPVSQLDVFATLLDLAGVGTGVASSEGASLEPYLLGYVPRGPVPDLHAEVFMFDPARPEWDKEAVQTTLIRGHRKVIHDEIDNRWTFYDLASDPGESNPRIGEGDRWRDLALALSRWEARRTYPPHFRDNPSRTLTPEERELLESLGYLH